MAFGKNALYRGAKGAEVEELQLRLAGFYGTVWDGDFGPATEYQVMAFQRLYMKMNNPTGTVENDTFDAIERFVNEFPIDFIKLRCDCGECEGFGQERFKGEYRPEKAEIEAYHRYEYPGIHKAILHTYRATQFYVQEAGYDLPFITCGYRCWINNEIKGRKSTNHMGKALDCDFPMHSGENKRDDMNRCDAVRGILVEKSNFQIGWGAANRKALEPSNIAPSWIHMDVRSYAPRYLEERYFVKRPDELDRY